MLRRFNWARVATIAAPHSPLWGGFNFGSIEVCGTNGIFSSAMAAVAGLGKHRGPTPFHSLRNPRRDSRRLKPWKSEEPSSFEASPSESRTSNRHDVSEERE